MAQQEQYFTPVMARSSSGRTYFVTVETIEVEFEIPVTFPTWMRALADSLNEDDIDEFHQWLAELAVKDIVTHDEEFGFAELAADDILNDMGEATMSVAGWTG